MEYDALWMQTNGHITLRVYRIYSNIAGEARYQVRLFDTHVYVGHCIFVAGSLEDAKHWALSFLEGNTAGHATSPLRAQDTCGARLAEFENTSQV